MLLVNSPQKVDTNLIDVLEAYNFLADDKNTSTQFLQFKDEGTAYHVRILLSKTFLKQESDHFYKS